MLEREREGERKLEYEIACHGSSGVLLALVVYGSSRERTCFNLNNVHTRYRRKKEEGKGRTGEGNLRYVQVYSRTAAKPVDHT